MVRRAGFVFVVLACTSAFSTPAAGQPVQIVEGTVHYQNIQTALTFLREHGETEAADQIEEHLDDGEIYSDPNAQSNATTDPIDNNVVIHSSILGWYMPPSKRDTPLDPVKDFKAVVELARTLFHENYHVNQQNITEFFDENELEYPAWISTIFQMGKWVDIERAQFDRHYNPRQPMSPAEHATELQKLKDKIEVLIDYQASFVDPQSNNAFGGNDHQWVAQNNTYWQHQIKTMIDPKIGSLVNPPKPTTTGGAGTPPLTAATPETSTSPNPPPPPKPQPPAITVTTITCAPCQGIADEIRSVREFARVRAEAAAKAEAAVARNQQRVADLQKRVGNLEAELERAAGTGGSSFDPSTGQTVEAYDQGNGTVKVTVKDAAGNVIEERVRDSSARKAEMNRQIADANAEIAKLQAEATQLAAQAAAARKLASETMARLERLVNDLEDCVKKYCSNIPTAAALNLLGLPYRELSALGNPMAFNPFPGERNGPVQLMMIEIRVANVDGIAVPGNAAASKGARHTGRGTPSVLASLLSWLRPGRPTYFSTRDMSTPWLPNVEVQQRRIANESPVQTLLTSLGQSTGEAFEVQIFNSGGKPFRLAAEALVVEPLKDEVKRQVQNRLPRLLSAASPVTARLNGYCLEFLKLPPGVGSIFRIAAPELQQRFAPMRRIMDTSRRLQDLGQLRPDSSPDGYFHSIRQWAMWTVEQKFNERRFADAFVQHTRKSVEAAKRPWNAEAEKTLRSAVPNRWADIQKILIAAGHAAGVR